MGVENIPPGPRQDDLSRKIKLEVADFSGHGDARALLLDWLTSIEDYFTWYHIEDPQRVTFVKMKFKGPARIWWKNIDDHNVPMGRPPITR